VHAGLPAAEQGSKPEQENTDLGSGQAVDILHSMQTALVTYGHEVLMFTLRICNPKLRTGKAC
jgi:hypothetical protein